MCHAPGLHCACFLEGVAPFYNDRVALRGWQRIDVYVEQIEQICVSAVMPQVQPQILDDDVVALFDLCQHLAVVGRRSGKRLLTVLFSMRKWMIILMLW